MGRFKTYNKKTNKYHNHVVSIGGKRFASKGEAQRYLELCDMKKHGEILDFESQPKFELQPKFTKNGVKYREISYLADFKVTHLDGHQTIEDVKGKGGYTTPDFVIKHKLFEYHYPDLQLEIVQRSGKNIEYLLDKPKDETDN